MYSCTVDRTRRSRDVQTLVLTYWSQTEYLEYNVQQSKFLLSIYSTWKKKNNFKINNKTEKTFVLSLFNRTWKLRILFTAKSVC